MGANTVSPMADAESLSSGALGRMAQALSIGLLGIGAACSDSNDSGVADDGTSAASGDSTSSGADDVDGSSGSADVGDETAAEPAAPDFSAFDARLDSFIADNPAFEGASVVIVREGEGSIHEAAFGTYTLDTIVLLASTSKVPSTTLMMALSEDDALDFEIDAPIESYLQPWEGVWPGVTTEQLLSNTSGIPGLQYADDYGAHICQYLPVSDLQACGQTLYETPLDALPSNPPGTVFDYGGSQWQIAGALGEVVGGQTWAELFEQYIGAPCDLEVFEYGNMLASPEGWAGNPDDLNGKDNPSIEGGAMSDIADYAKLLSLHLEDGRCGDNQVLSAEALAFMRIDRGTPLGSRLAALDGVALGLGYGMGWWVEPREESEPNLFYDPGVFGAVSWIDTDRGYGGFVALADYTTDEASAAVNVIRDELIPLAAEAIDAAE